MGRGARSLKGGGKEGEIPRDLAPGGRDHGGRSPWDTSSRRSIEQLKKNPTTFEKCRV